MHYSCNQFAFLRKRTGLQILNLVGRDVFDRNRGIECPANVPFGVVNTTAISWASRRAKSLRRSNSRIISSRTILVASSILRRASSRLPVFVSSSIEEASA